MKESMKGSEAMSDWTKQTETMVNTWAEAQKKMWDGWFNAMQAMTSKNAVKNFEQERQKAMDAWEASVRKGLEAQGEWLRLWSESFSEERGASKPMVEWAKQSHEMMKSWAQSQEAFMKTWFDIARKMDGSSVGNLWESQGERAMKAWQEAAEKALQAQQDLTKLWNQTSKRAG